MNKQKQPKNQKAEIENAQPFDSVEEAWMWFILAQQARNEGARFSAGLGGVVRPCEPLDILNILQRLHRNRRLLRDHLLVLRHYGRRQMPPDSARPKERRSAKLWAEALERLEPVLERKGIIRKQAKPHANWVQEALIFEQGGRP